jgi:Outer membrane receptor for ferrienterochelin and colicins
MILVIVLASCSLAFAQQGRLKGKILDQDGVPVSFANVILEKGGTMVGGATSDFDGFYDINPIPPGTYDLKATFVGYNDYVLNGIVIPANKITDWNIKMTSGAINLGEVTVIDYEIPLISKDNTTSGTSVTAEEIAKLPNRSAAGVAASVGGVFSNDGEIGSIRGSREGAAYYIDGVKVIGSGSVPQGAIDQIDVILGGTPAMYGDAMGGIINMTTKGPSRTFGAGLELETSVEGYGHNRLGFNIQGPLIKGKKAETALLGFFLAGDLAYNKVGALSATGFYTASDEWQDYIEQNPLRLSGIGSGTYQNASFTRFDDLVYSKGSTNTSNYNINLSGNINVRTTETINLTIGGSLYKTRGHDFSRAYSYFDTDKNSVYDESTYRGFVRFTQRFPTSAESTSLISNFYYTLQADYTHFNSQSGDADLWDNIFQYGNLGKYITYKTPTYQLGSVDSVLVNGNYHNYDNVWVLNSWDYDTLVTFAASNFNPLLARYTENYYELYSPYGASGYYNNFTNLQLGGALLNGDSPTAIYGLYAAPGTVQGGYGKSVMDQVSVNVNASMTIGKGESSHEVKLGFQYEQRSSSQLSYSMNYWTLMRSLTNAHILELDLENPYVVDYDGFVDTVMYPRLYDGGSQYTFDARLRKAMGLDVEGTDYILMDSYDFNDNSIMYYDAEGNLKKTTVQGGLDISMFSPDELTRDGNFYIMYYGYDYSGRKHSLFGERPTMKDFFEDYTTDEKGNVIYTRPIGSFQPIYTAGYIQDKFAFKDLIFNIGVRADRFDANQSVLKDPYILYDYYTVGELDVRNGQANDGMIILDGNGQSVEVPNNIGDDYAVYVNKIDDISSIVGYRNGNTWYSATGAEISDPTVLDMGSGISPWIKDKNQQRVNENSFKDYDPQWSIMPRISFSFPISDEALFFAHYDVLTQRPSSSLYMNPLYYYYFSDYNGTLANPDLKPAQTIDYELGFTQKVTNTSSLTITAYYRELRNMIQMRRFTGAYPKDYNSFSNLDFSTVKGLTAEYDLRRTKNARVRASYTLQFANSTGATTTTAAALISAGVPNLRSTFPTPEDRRHQFNLVLDYRFSSGKKYDGPVINREKSGKSPIQVLSNTGFALTLNGGSGVPYTASRKVFSPISGGSNLLQGTYYGSRMPASFRLDLRVDKDFNFTLGGKKEGKTGRDAYVNVYLQVLNLLNSKNIVNVYSATGNADDDGYLTAPEYQRQINSQLDPQSFIEMYEIYVNSGGNYSTPRQIRLGLMFNF